MEKIKEDINAFQNSCVDCLLKAGLNDLRSYGRLIGMRAATKLKKADLIKEIVGVLCGEIAPSPTKRGAPVKNAHIDPKLMAEIERLKKECLYTNDCEEVEQSAGSDAPKSELKEKKNCYQRYNGENCFFSWGSVKFSNCDRGIYRTYKR